MYKNKYLKYKLKYLELKNQIGASSELVQLNPLDEIAEGEEGEWDFESNVDEMINNYYIKTLWWIRIKMAKTTIRTIDGCGLSLF